MVQSRRPDEGVRPHPSATETSGALAIRVPEELRERLRRVTRALDISALEVIEMGVDLAERRIAADEYE
jgi:hypothetical protein